MMTASSNHTNHYRTQQVRKLGFALILFPLWNLLVDFRQVNDDLFSTTSMEPISDTAATNMQSSYSIATSVSNSSLTNSSESKLQFTLPPTKPTAKSLTISTDSKVLRSSNSYPPNSSLKLPQSPPTTTKEPTKPLDHEIGRIQKAIGKEWRNTSQETQQYLYNLSLAPVSSTIPWPNLTSTAFYKGRLVSGYRNQMMVFTMFVLEALKDGHGQILYPSLQMSDTGGTNKLIQFDGLWNVSHWNTFYPQLPRLVSYDPIIHDQYNIERQDWYRSPDDEKQFSNKDGSVLVKTPTRPYRRAPKRELYFARAVRYQNGKGPWTKNGHRHPADILMITKALKPHDRMQQLIDTQLHRLINTTGAATTTNNGIMGTSNTTANITTDLRRTATASTWPTSTTTLLLPYMTLHARVEPDMQRNPACRDLKVLNLTSIVQMVETKWNDPPIRGVFIAINRNVLEREGKLPPQKNKQGEINWIAIENLKELNRLRSVGMWGGRVPVFEFGASVISGSFYQRRPGTSGAMLDFHIAVQAQIFIGTEVSSFSQDIMADRFFKGVMENYKYVPRGVEDWTSANKHMVDPPGFHC